MQGFVSAFPSMAWLAVRGGGVWVEKTVKVLTQLLQEAANADLIKHLSRV